MLETALAATGGALLLWIAGRALRRRKAKASAEDWRGLMGRPDVFIVDTETTGLWGEAEVIEAVAIDTTGALRFAAVSMPEGPVKWRATRVHGMTRVTLRKAGAAPWPAVQAQLLPVLKEASAILAWNAEFDSRMLAQTAKRHGLKWPRLPWRDLLPEYRAIRGEQPAKGRHKLQAVAEREAAIIDGPQHRGEADCRRVLAVMAAVAGLPVPSAPDNPQARPELAPAPGPEPPPTIGPAELAKADALTRLMSETNPLTEFERTELFEKWCESDLEDNETESDTEPSIEHTVASERKHRAFMQAKDKDLGWQIQTVETAFRDYLETGWIPAPHYPLRVAILLRKAKERERERAFLAAWCRHFPAETGGRYDTLAERARKTGAIPS